MKRSNKLFRNLMATCLSVAVFIPVLANAQVRGITKVNSYWAQGTGNTIIANTPLGNNFVTEYGTNTGRTDNDLTLQNFSTTAGKVYGMASTLPSSVTFRRVDNANVQGIRQQMFFMNLDSLYDGNSSNRHTPFQLRTSYSNDMTDAFSGRILNRGSDNIFGNINEGFGNYNNIERIDIVFQAPQQVYSFEGNGAVLFERGTPTHHGQVKLAAILSVDASGNPTSYSAIVFVDNTDWPANDITPSYNWAVSRRDVATEPDMILSNDYVGYQSIGGIFVPYSSFGLSAGTVIYGYSIIPADFTGSTSADIIDYQNSTLYPLNTDASDNLGAGGIDIIGVTGAFVENKSIPQTLSGTVFHDANGLTDNTINGTGINNIAGSQLYVNIIDPDADTVVATATVAANGTWTANGVPANTTYQAQLNTVQGVVGTSAPMSSLAGQWVSTGEFIGTSAGNDGNANGSISVSVELSTVSNIDFGIEQYPTANAQSYNISMPVNNSIMVLNGTGALNSPGMLTGTDPEDGAMNASKTVTITTLPTGATLLYNGSPVTANQQIANYDPAKLAVKFTGVGYSQIKFDYYFADAAGVMGSTASYAINMPQPLDLKLVSFTAQSTNDADMLTWITVDEKNMDKFELEFSTDATQFRTIGSVTAKNTIGTNTYQFAAPASNGNRYYRLKMVETDGKTTYSNVAFLKNDGKSKNMSMELAPNPVGTNTTTHLTIQRSEAGKLSIRIYNQAGQLIQMSEASATQGSTAIDINTSTWTPGVYFVTITDQATGEHTTIKVVK